MTIESSGTPKCCIIDIGIFAYNEVGSIEPMLESLLQQTVFQQDGLSVKIHVLANGCTDQTVAHARSTLLPHDRVDTQVHDLPEGGKSRTWNRFVHDLARPDVDYLIFMDADIIIPQPDMLTRLVELIRSRPELDGVSSKPVKDIAYRPELATSRLDKVIAAAGGGLNDWKASICGQLYILKGQMARSFHLPIGLPVEDGFVRAMVQTDRFSSAQDRGVLGGDEARLGRLLSKTLPRVPYGYVSFDFLTKRLRFFLRAKEKRNAKRVIVTLLGTAFDLTVWLKAQIRMARGVGADYS